MLRFLEFEMDLASSELRRGGSPVRIQRKPPAFLEHLVRHRDRVVSKQELFVFIANEYYVERTDEVG